jgi:hypothetical protein
MAIELNEAQKAFLQREAENAADLVLTSDEETLMDLYIEEAMKSSSAIAVLMAAKVRNWTGKHAAVAVAYAMLRQARAITESHQFGDTNAD